MGQKHSLQLWWRHGETGTAQRGGICIGTPEPRKKIAGKVCVKARSRHGSTCPSGWSLQTCVTQCQPEDTHREFQTQQQKWIITPKGRRSTDPITNARAKVRTAPGMVLDTVKPTFQSIVQTPPFKTKQDSSPPDRPRKTKLLAFLTRITITTIYTNKYMDI